MSCAKTTFLQRGRTLVAGVLVIGIGLSGCATATESGNGSQGAMRTVKHELGEVKIPVKPQRIVITKGIASLVALGVVPAGARNIQAGMQSFPDKLPMLKNSVDLGGQDLNLEQVLSVKPDLIVTTTPQYDKQYAQMSKIAPTYVFKGGQIDRKHRWGEMLTMFGELTGTQDRAKKLLSDYQARAADFKNKFGAKLKGKKVSILRVTGDNLIVYTMGSFAGGVVRDAGLERPDNQNLDAAQTKELTGGKDNEAFQLSPERLREADADILFIVSRVDPNPAKRTDKEKAAVVNLEKVTKHPLWKNLNAVQNNQVFTVGSVWDGESVMDANAVLDDLVKHLGKL